EVLSVYVKNVPSNALASEIEVEFKKFGKIRPDGVAIRTRKDINVCYAFVEYEDITGVNNAIKASTVEIAGQQEEEEEATKRTEKGVLEVETIATEAMIVITHDQEATATIVKPGHIPTPTRLLKMVTYHQIEDHEGLKVPLVTSIIVLEESNLMNY
ncbi:putative G3BP-like protein isoform X1, partial [Tanacetum coccineum]